MWPAGARQGNALWTLQPGGPAGRSIVRPFKLGVEFAREPAEAARLGRELRLDARSANIIQGAAEIAAIWPRLGGDDLAPSAIYNLLKGIDPAALSAYSRIGVLQRDEVAYERLMRYLEHLRNVKSEITGDYLRELGLPPGPLYRELLDGLLAAKLDGLLPTREDEERWIHAWLSARGL